MMQRFLESVTNAGYTIRPAEKEEVTLFYRKTDSEYTPADGYIGYMRMYFGKTGKEFWHSWFPYSDLDEENTDVFKKDFYPVVDLMREYPFKDIEHMREFTAKAGGKLSDSWSKHFGYIVESRQYRYLVKCNPVAGDYNGYFYCFKKNNNC